MTLPKRIRALTLWPEWAWAVHFLDKRVENRTWAPPASVIGQRVAIHAGLKLDLAARQSLRMNGHDYHTPERDGYVHGAVESVVTIAGWVRDFRGADVALDDEVSAHVTDPEAIDAVFSPWFMGPIGWVLTDIIALPEPVPCKGAQGLWTLPADVESAVLAQLGGER